MSDDIVYRRDISRLEAKKPFGPPKQDRPQPKPRPEPTRISTSIFSGNSDLQTLMEKRAKLQLELKAVEANIVNTSSIMCVCVCAYCVCLALQATTCRDCGTVLKFGEQAVCVAHKRD